MNTDMWQEPRNNTSACKSIIMLPLPATENLMKPSDCSPAQSHSPPQSAKANYGLFWTKLTHLLHLACILREGFVDSIMCQ
jgi:hypothetical protein